MDEKLSRKRHLAKTITWRIIGTIDTVLIGWVVTGDPWIGVQVGGVEMVTKMALYYFHERAWFRYGMLGRKKNES
ncbi:MAG: DUF2061 domain-containing protein [Crocinitomicaceae bacterium TMED114]|nr:MAG: DUF2061 domain-containing protein [Crocinitomicaceae bacterium TMED114]|tara:strand:+ start:292 stop:516 length:225 start_codon:yes stop_codon:yes gene_type:complete